MKVFLTRAQAFEVHLEGNLEFVRACFFLGYSLATIKEYVKGPDFQDSSALIINAAKEAGMTEDYTVTVI